MVNVTLNTDGTLTIAGAFSVNAPDFTLKSADGTGFAVTNLTALQTALAAAQAATAGAQAAVAALQTKVTNAQKALA